VPATPENARANGCDRDKDTAEEPVNEALDGLGNAEEELLHSREV
jgi:hypothetical protein